MAPCAAGCVLLDMAISPAMLRRAFNDETDPEIAEAMLRYFVRKKDHAESDRDKTDIVSTFSIVILACLASGSSAATGLTARCRCRLLKLR